MNEECLKPKNKMSIFLFIFLGEGGEWGGGCICGKKSQISGMFENLYFIIWISRFFIFFFFFCFSETINVFANYLFLKTRVKVEVHLLSPSSMFRVTTKFRGTHVLTHVLKTCEEHYQSI